MMVEKARLNAVDREALQALQTIGATGVGEAPVRMSRSQRAQMWVLRAALVLAAVLGLWSWLQRPETGPSVAPLPQGDRAAVAEPPAQQPDGKGVAILSASGYVVARRRATVSSQVVGRVDALLIEEGVRVESGQVLARLDDGAIRAQEALAVSQVAAAQARVSEASVLLTRARQQFDRIRTLHGAGLVSQAELDQSRAELDTQAARRETAEREAEVSVRQLAVVRKSLDDMAIRAPFSGIVISQDAQPGEIISPSSAGGGFTRTGIGTIVDVSSLEVEVDINEAFIDRVTPNQMVETVLNAYPGWSIPSHVINLVPTANRQTATVKVRIALDEQDARILPDMGVQVRFLETASAAHAL